MADLQKTVEIIFGGRNDLSKVIGDVENSLGNLNAASQPFADMADNVLRAETAVIGLGLAFAGLSINQAGNFNDQFAEISTLIDQNVSDLGGYRQSILDYSNDSTQSLESINGAVYSAISAGVEYTSALGVMTDAEKLAVAGKSDLNSTLVGLASTMNAYGAEADQASDYSDIFFTTVKQGQTTIPELAASLSQVTSIASSAGIPFDDLSASIAALTASGMPTSQAITSIKAAISNIIKPSAEARDVAASLGIEFNATALQAQGLDGFMQMLQTATGGNVEVMGKLFGSVEGLNGVMTLAADNSGIFADSLEAMENRAGATDAAFEKMVDNFGLNNQKLVNNIQTVLIGVGGQLLDEYGDVVNSLIANLQGIGSAIDNGDLDGLIGIFESAMVDIEGLLSGVADVLPEALAGVDWNDLASSFDNLKGSVGDGLGAIFGDIDLSTVDGVRDGVQTIIDLLSGLTNTSAGVVDGMRPLFVALGTLAQNFADADANGQEFAGQILGVGKSVNAITGFLSSATSALGGLSNGLLLLGGGSVLKGIGSLVTSLGGGAGLSGVLAGGASSAATLAAQLGPLAAVTTASGVAVYKAVDGYLAMRDAQEQAIAAEDRAAASAQNLSEKYIDISASTGVFVESTRDIQQALEDGRLKISNFTGELVSADQYSEEFAQSMRASADATWSLDDAMPEVYQHLREIGFALDETGDKIEPVVDEFEQLAASVRQDLGMAGETIKGTFSVVPSVMGETSDSLKDVADSSDVAKDKLLELASNERISAMELSVDFNIAQLESDTKIATSLIDGIGDTIGSVTSLIGSLTGDLLNATSFTDKWLIEDLIKDQNDRQEKALDKQDKLLDAQIEKMEAQTDAIKNGDGLITIKADGLESHLRAFMMAVLEEVQIEVSEQEAAFLLGVN